MATNPRQSRARRSSTSYGSSELCGSPNGRSVPTNPFHASRRRLARHAGTTISKAVAATLSQNFKFARLSSITSGIKFVPN